MSWAIGFDTKWNRWIGYGVPATCDYPDCGEQIDRGLSYVCGSDPYGGEYGCGLYFCSAHLYPLEVDDRVVMVCDRSPYLGDDCVHGMYEPTPDTREWLEHMLDDESWAQWREENPDQVADAKQKLAHL